MIKLKYDASFCTIENPEELDDITKDKIDTLLSYKDSKIDYQNNQGNSYIPYKDPTVKLFVGNTFYTGLLPRVVWLLKKNEKPFELISNVPKISPIKDVVLPEWLYDHQVDIINKCLEVKRGIIESPTGSGKTVSIANLLKFFPTQNVIITVPQQNLLEQLSETIEEHLKEDVGRVSGTKKEFKRITVGVINSLSKMAKEMPSRFSNIELLICDEAHRVGANFYLDLCNACINTDYRFGFSGTANRESGDDKVMEGQLGPKVLKITEDYLMKKGILSDLKYFCVPVKSLDLTYNKYDSRRGTYRTKNRKPDRLEVYKKNIVRHIPRNNLIVDIVDYYLRSDPKFPCIVFVEHIEHGEELERLLLRRNLQVPFVHGKKKKESNQLIIDLNDWKKAAIVTKIFNEGVDIKKLRLGILAGGGSSSNRLKQQIGRQLRTFIDKPNAVFVDFRDSDRYYLRSNSENRERVVRRDYPRAFMTVTQEEILKLAANGFKDI